MRSCRLSVQPTEMYIFSTELLYCSLGPFHGAIAAPLSRVVVVVVVVVVDIDAQAARDSTACDIRWMGVRRLAVANGPNIFQMLLVLLWRIKYDMIWHEVGLPDWPTSLWRCWVVMFPSFDDWHGVVSKMIDSSNSRPTRRQHIVMKMTYGLYKARETATRRFVLISSPQFCTEITFQRSGLRTVRCHIRSVPCPSSCGRNMADGCR